MSDIVRDPELEQRLISARNGLRLGQPCYAYQALPSTMDLAHRLAAEGAPEGACVWAETQTGGRGRAGRAWISPPGGLYLSLIFRPTRPSQELSQLALVAGVAVVETIHEVTGLWASLRWPNDVLLNAQKVCGILVEASVSDYRLQTTDHSETRNPQPVTRNCYAIIGIGLNVTTAREALPPEATALAHWANPISDRFALAGTLLRCLEQTYGQWTAEGFAPIRARLSRWMGMFGRLVRIATTSEEFHGQAMDIDDAGRLLVRLDSGVIRAVEMGEVHLLR